MIKRTYKLPFTQYTCEGSPKAILTNGYGSYFSIDEESSYQGWSIFDSKNWRMKKVIEEIIPSSSRELVEISTQQHNIQKKYSDGLHETFTMYRNTLLYSQTGLVDGKLKLVLDNRDAYDKSEMGRFYSVEEKDDFVLIKFEKKNTSSGKLIEESFIGIKGIKKFNVIGNWIERKYSQNSSRKANDTYWVYEALEIEPRNHLVFSYGETESEARTLADISYYHFEEILSNVAEKNIDNHLHCDHLPLEIGVATSVASDSLNSLLQNIGGKKGMFAGYPWFFQLWSRDELISLGGLISLARKEKNNNRLLSIIKKILDRHIHSILDDGTLLNRYPESKIGSIDSIGWLAKRSVEFFELLREKNKLYSFYSPQELFFYLGELMRAKDNLKEKRMSSNGFIKNNPQETWMDTNYLDEGRSGERIEIQALYYSIYSSLIYISDLVVEGGSNKGDELVREQKEFKKLFKKYFLHSSLKTGVIDGIDSYDKLDETIRPNALLAMYISPDLFSKKESIKIIDSHLKALYLPWGGLTSLDKEHRLFEPSHTGETDKSYHRGDSWYFINNISAMVLFETDHEKYSQEIKQIIDASSKDILEQGYVGGASELSSAAHQEAEGALAQAWSASTFLEAVLLIHALDE